MGAAVSVRWGHAWIADESADAMNAMDVSWGRNASFKTTELQYTQQDIDNEPIKRCEGRRRLDQCRRFKAVSEDNAEGRNRKRSMRFEAEARLKRGKNVEGRGMETRRKDSLCEDGRQQC